MGKKRGESPVKVLLLPVFTIAVFLVFVVYITALVGGFSASGYGGSLRWILKLRLGTLIGTGKHLTVLAFLSRELRTCEELFTPIAVYGAGAWLVLLVIGRIRGTRGRDHPDWLILSFLLYAVVYLLVFRQPVYLHSYMVIYAGPAVAFAAILAARDLISLCLAPKRWVKVAAAVLLGYLFLAAGLPEFLELQSNPARDDWIDLGKFLRGQVAPDEAIILSFRDGHLYTEYYSDREILRGVTTVNQFEEAQKASRNEVVVYMDTARARASAELSEFLEANYVSMPIRVNSSDYQAFVIRIPRRYRH